MTRLTNAILALAIGLLATACQLTPNFQTGYEIDAWPSANAAPAGGLAVESFAEERGERVYTGQGKIFLTYVPFLPWVALPFERLDESVRIQSDAIEQSGRGITMGARQNVAPPFEQFTYPVSFAKAVADDLGKSGLFSSVEYVGAGAPGDARFLLRGQVRESPLRQTTTSFGLGMVGVLLWMLPVPMSKTTGAVSVDLELIDRSTNEAIWSDTVSASIRRYVMLYTSSAMVYGRAGAFSLNVIPPPSDAGVDRRSLFGWHFGALRKAMLEARPAITEAVRGR